MVISDPLIGDQHCVIGARRPSAPGPKRGARQIENAKNFLTFNMGGNFARERRHDLGRG
jgi:hypothetical protein